MKTSTTQTSLSVPLLALMMSFLAFSIDAVLPALEIIGKDLNIKELTEKQQVISSIFLGLAIGQLGFGPLSDSLGRKPAIYIGFLFFSIGTLICILAQSMPVMVVGRFLQGFGLSSNRIVCVALIRDVFKGNEMAKIMSLIMTIFILIPILAPILGQYILQFGDWELIFIVLFIFTLLVTFAFALKQQETLAPEHRIPFSFSKSSKALKEIAKEKQAMQYTIISGLVFGAFMTYLNLSQDIFQNLYQKGENFPYYFGLVAVSVGLTSFLNGKFVDRFGMLNIVRYSLFGILVLSLGFQCYLIVFQHPSFTVFLSLWIPMMFCVGFLFGNLNSIAMEPLGHIAGIGASVVGSLSTLIGVPISAYVGSLYDGNLQPLVGIFLVVSTLSLVYIFWSKWVGDKG
ncbi:MAG: multidrug effflux MFS transporter [Flavobacteriales bacterium]